MACMRRISQLAYRGEENTSVTGNVHIHMMFVQCFRQVKPTTPYKRLKLNVLGINKMRWPNQDNSIINDHAICYLGSSDNKHQ